MNPILIYELEHHETLYPFLKSIEQNPRSKIVYTSQPVYNSVLAMGEIYVDRYSFFIKGEDESERSFLNRFLKQIPKNGKSVVYFNTLANNFIVAWLRLLFVGKHTKTILVIHGINSFFKPKFSILPRPIIRNAGKLLLARCIDVFIVHSTTMKQIADQLFGKYTFKFLPGAVLPKKLSPVPANKPLQLFIPGTIDERRKNLAFVYRCIHEMESQKMEVAVFFAGKWGESEQVKLAEKLMSQPLEFVQLTFMGGQTPVEQSKFEEALSTAHFVWVPSVVQSAAEGNTSEIYGTTKCSGGIFDAIRRGKPLLYPQEIRLDAGLKEIAFRYKNEKDFVEFLKTMLISESRYSEWTGRCTSIGQEYRSEFYDQAVQQITTV